MKIKWKISVAGTVHNVDGGVTVGDVMEVDDSEAERYIALGYAEAANQGRRSEEHAVQEFSKEERAVLDKEIIGASHGAVPQPRTPRPPQVEGEEEPEPVEVKHQVVTGSHVNAKGETVANMKTVKDEPPEPKVEPKAAPKPAPRSRRPR